MRRDLKIKKPAKKESTRKMFENIVFDFVLFIRT